MAVPSYELVLVAYRSRSLVEALLDSLPSRLPVVIVDNAHGVDGLPDVASARPATRYLDGPGAGFAAGANLGARSSQYDTIIFVNPDSSPTLAQLDSLAAELDHDAHLAAVSAITVLPDGRVEIGVGGWEPTVRRALVHAVGAHKLFPTAGLWARPAPGRPIELDWLSGACMAVSRQLFCDLGGFDERFYVYNEDVAFGRQIREAGLRQMVRTDLLVPHLGGGSGEGKSRMVQLRAASLLQYVRRHNSRSRLEAMRLVLTSGTLGRYLLFILLRRHGAARENAAYLRGLWFGPPSMS
ncbi:MAG: glycosyltransferase family 2 protein [Pseudonocardia sp.]